MRRPGLSSILVHSICVASAARARADDVFVRGDPLEPPSRDGSVAGSVVRRDRLVAPGLTASDVLREEPGVTVSESGGAGAPSTASIRGATAAETPVYIGGVRVNDDTGGAADLALVPLWLVHRVEIYRGNAPAFADRAGIGGAIFFEPLRPERVAPTAGALVGSYGARGVWAYGGAGDERSSAAVGARVDGAENDYPFVDDRGTRFEPGNAGVVRRTNADVATYDLWALDTARVGDDARADVLFNAVSRTQGLPGLGLLPTRLARATTSRELGGLTTTTACARDCTLTFATTAILARSTIDDPLRELGLAAARVTTEGVRVQEEVRTRFSPVARVGVETAADVSVERLSIDASSGDDLHARRLTSRGAALVSWAATDSVSLTALGGLACDGTAAGAADDGVCGTSTPSLRAGAEWKTADVAVLANVGRYGRVPTLGERFGTSAAVRGNAALVPEAGLTADAGVRASVRRLAADVFAFGREASDLIAYVRSSAGFVVPYNVGRAAVRGVEAAIACMPIDRLEVHVAATVLDARDTSPSRVTVNDVLPFHSRLVVAPRATLDLGGVPWLGVDAARVRASYVYQSSRYADAAGLVVIPAQGSLDVEVEAYFARRHLALRARLADALDQTRFDLVGFPLPGRAAHAAMEARW